jgi:sulfur carrier protein ThiS adenylyltransferase
MSELFQSMPPGIYNKIRKKKIFIAGAGGLGSNVAMLLVRAGLEHLTIVDFDVIASHNLNRQFFFLSQIGMNKVDALKMNLLNINPEVEIKTYTTKLSQDTFHLINDDEYDIILECFDDPQAKAQFVAYVLKNSPKVPIIAVSGLAGATSLESIKLSKGTGLLWLVGDGVSDVSEGMGTMSTRVMFAATIQAHQAISLLV